MVDVPYEIIFTSLRGVVFIHDIKDRERKETVSTSLMTGHTWLEF